MRPNFCNWKKGKKACKKVKRWMLPITYNILSKFFTYYRLYNISPIKTVHAVYSKYSILYTQWLLNSITIDLNPKSYRRRHGYKLTVIKWWLLNNDGYKVTRITRSISAL